MAIDIGDDVVLDPDRDPDNRNYFIRSRWISSFQGYIQDDPGSLSDGTRAPPPPQLGAFQPRTPNCFTQIDGYYVFAALSDIVFGFGNAVSGGIYMNLGKDHQVLMSVTGTYDCRTGRLGVVEGTFAWQIAAEGYEEIGIEGYLALTRANELTWLITGASRAEPAASPAIVAGGRMRRAP